LPASPQWVYLTPGVKLKADQDALGQQYISPEKAVCEQGSDVIIVGRGIITAKDPLSEAKKYREQGWQAYRRRIKM
jgi:orotidine-5'-phosphate decarboxylase